jgi:hypothetical protein
MTGVSLNCIEAGADDFYNLVPALFHQSRQRGADGLLVVCDQNAHERQLRRNTRGGNRPKPREGMAFR